MKAANGRGDGMIISKDLMIIVAVQIQSQIMDTCTNMN